MKCNTIVSLFLLFSFCSKQSNSQYNYWIGSKFNLNYTFEPPSIDSSIDDTYWYCVNKEGKIVLQFDGLKKFYNRNSQLVDSIYGSKYYANGFDFVDLIPSKTDTNVFYCLYQDWYNGYNQLYNAKFDLRANNGKGGFIYRNKLLYEHQLNSPYHTYRVCPNIKASSYWVCAGFNDTLYSMRFNEGLIDTITQSFFNIAPSLPNMDEYVYGLYFSNTSKFLSIAFHFSYQAPIIGKRKDFVVLYSFDTLNGTVSNGRLVDSASIHNYSSISFSPNDSFLYLLDENQSPGYKVLSQYSSIAINIPSSKKTITFSNEIESIFLGSNAKLYISYLYISKIGVINNPDFPLDKTKITWIKMSKRDTIFNQFNDIQSRDFHKLKFAFSFQCDSMRFWNLSDTSVFSSFWWYFHDFKNNKIDSINSFQAVFPNAKGNSKIYVRLKGIAKSGFIQWYSDTIDNFKCLARVGFSSLSGCQYVLFTFRDSSLTDTAINNNLTYHWVFGDGTDSSYTTLVQNKINTINHIYKSSGTFTIKLIVGNGFCYDTVVYINQVTILPAPKPGFSTSASSWCGLPATLTLTANTTSNVVRYFYNMGNGDTLSSALPSVQYTYTQPGRYKITQRLMGSTGCVTEDSTFVTLQYGLSAKDTVNVLYTTVPDAGSTRTVWRRLPHAAAYRINGITVTDTFYTALGLNTLVNTYSYTVTGVDSCGNTSATAPPSKSMLLTGSGSTDNEYALLTYTPYSFWQQGVSNYEIQVQFQNQWRTLANLGSSTLPFKDLHFADTLMQNGNSIEKCYRIIAHENNGNRQQSVSNEACVPFAPVVFIPNAFSPNGDGINDRFAPVLLGMNVYYLRIYDRWGQEVYSTSYQNPDEGWDGKVLGQEAKPGIYVWVFSAASRLKSAQYNNPANSIEKRGTVVLIR